MKVLLIGNPVAGKGKAVSRISEFLRIEHGKGYRPETFFTVAPGDAKARAACIDRDVDRLIVVGGDGTINEVLNGLPDPSRIPIVIFPAGTSNVLAHELCVPRTPVAISSLLEHGEIRRLDMGLIDRRRFLLFVSAGIEAMVTREVIRTKTTSLGKCRYVLPTLRALGRYRSPRLKVTMDRQISLTGQMVIVSNTRRYWGGLSFTDQAQCDSGHLDVCVLPTGGLPLLVGCYLAAALRRTSHLKRIRYVSGKQIHIESSEPVEVQVDGDYFGTTPLGISVLPAVVPIVVPSSVMSFHPRPPISPPVLS